MAKENILSEEALRKYEMQTKEGEGIVNLVVSGRMESFVAIPACFDNPIWGYGPWAIDMDGYYENFLQKYRR